MLEGHVVRDRSGEEYRVAGVAGDSVRLHGVGDDPGPKTVSREAITGGGFEVVR
jgi:hypothetical protein